MSFEFPAMFRDTINSVRVGSQLTKQTPPVSKQPQPSVGYVNGDWAKIRPDIVNSLERHDSRAVFHLAFFLVAFLIIFSRRPDAILNAQFFAEDGQRWFADAYNLGLRSLLIPDELGGYMHTVPRLTALLALLFPFRLAPLVMNLSAIAIQITPASFFLSSRFSKVILWKRLAASFVYLALPNTPEVNANATTIQWHLGLLACLVLLAGPGNSWKWRLFDGVVLVLISIESPMGILLVAVAGILWLLRRNQSSFISLALLVPGGVLQIAVVLFSHARKLAPNGANLTRLVSILGRQVFLASLVGRKTVLHLMVRHGVLSLSVIETTATVAGVALLLYAVWRAPAELKLYIVFAFAALAMGLKHPIPGILPLPQWELLRYPGHGNRYYFLPMIAFLATVFWIVTNSCLPRALRYFTGILLLLLLPLGIVRDWEYPAFRDFHFRQYAAKFEVAPPGTKIIIPLNPGQPANWSMELTKK